MASGAGPRWTSRLPWAAGALLAFGGGLWVFTQSDGTPPAPASPAPRSAVSPPDALTLAAVPVDAGPAKPPAADAAASPDVAPVDATPRPAYGTVNVATPGGWAEIYVGRRKVGRAPGQLKLPAGPHRLRILPLGRKPAIRRRVVVKAGRISRLVVPVE